MPLNWQNGDLFPRKLYKNNNEALNTKDSNSNMLKWLTKKLGIKSSTDKYGKMTARCKDLLDKNKTKAPR